MTLTWSYINLISFLSVLLLLNSCSDNGVSFEEVPTDNFWETATPASQQMDEEKIKELESSLQEAPGLYSFLVIRNGKIVSETYRNGASRNVLLHLRSVTKAVTGLLTAKLLYDGPLENTDQSIGEFFPEIPENSDWQNVKVHHLLNMVSGMNWQEEQDLELYENNLDDPLSFIFSRDIIHTPGTYYEYNSTSAHLLSYILHRSVNASPGEFAQSAIWEPLGVNGSNWETDGNGIERGGAGLELTARDLAKIGLLFLQKGQWENQQMISEDWVEQTWNEPLSVEGLPFDWKRRNFWWTRTMNDITLHFADGYGGQVLLVAPEFDLIVVTNRKYRVNGETNRNAFDQFFGELLPMVIDSIDK